MIFVPTEWTEKDRNTNWRWRKVVNWMEK